MTASTSTISLYNAAINSGNAVNLNGSDFSYEINILSNKDPAPGKFDKTEINNQGFENPDIRVSGYVSVDQTDSNFITKDLLCEFAKAQTDTYLIIRYGSEGTETALTDIDGTTTVLPTGDAGIKVVLDKIRIKSLPTARNGHVLSFDIDMFEDD